MKNFILLLLTITAVMWGNAQNITHLEYFVDTDPGIGSANPVSIGTPGQNVENFSFTIPLTSYGDGFHRLFIRAKDANGQWSITYQRPFFKQAFPPTVNPYSVVKLEYFIGSDPGVGAGTPVTVTQGENVADLVFTVPLEALSDGFHRFYLRALDSKGSWSVSLLRNVYKYTFAPLVDKNITAIEYYFDTDPGIGSGQPLSFTPGVNFEFETVIDVSALSTGFHKLFVRAKDQTGAWSVTHTKAFFSSVVPNTEEANIVSGEYFLNTDPGIGNASPISVDQMPNVVDQNFVVEVGELSSGFHKMFMRFKDQNGKWSHCMRRDVFVDGDTGFELPQITRLEYFYDTDPGYGNGILLENVPYGQAIEDFTASLSTESLSDGFHTLYLRARDARGQWSPTLERSYYKFQTVTPQPSVITQLKYYISSGEGINLNEGVLVNDFEATSDLVNHEITIPLTGFAVGNYYLYAIAKALDGKETHMAVDSFRFCNNVAVASFTWEAAGTTGIQFNNNSVLADTCFWDFGDGYTSNLRHPPVHFYPQSPDTAKYAVKLTVSNDCNQSEMIDSVIVIYNPAPLSANFTRTIDENDIYSFLRSDFAYSDGNGNPFHHVFVASKYFATGDSLLLNGQQVEDGSEILADEIDNLVYKPAQNQNGYSRSYFYFRVNDGYQNSESLYSCSFNVNAVNFKPTYSLTIDEIKVVENSLMTNIPNWLQDLDDGDPEEDQQLYVNIEYVSGVNLFDVAPTLVNNTDLQFTLRDNTTGLATYQIRVQDYIYGQPSADSVHRFTIESKPFRAQLAATPSQACTGQDVVFTSTSPQQGVIFNWNFGEGAMPATYQGYEPGPVVYSTAGSKTAKLKITLGAQSDSANITLAVNTTPEASFLVGSDVFILSDTIYFYNTSTGGATYEWDFDDGSPVVTLANTSMVKHKYNAVDGSNFTPVLTARNGSCTDVFQKLITFIDAMPPDILTTTFPTSYDVNETITASLTAQDDENGLKKATFYYRSLSSNIWRTREIDPSGNQFSTTITETMGDQVGIEYYFDVFNNLNIKKSSQHTYAYLRFDSGLPIPNIVAGTTADKYQIISIPLVLENSAVDVVLDEFPAHDPTQWRLFHYTPTRLLEYPADFQAFERGKGYWLITRNQFPINTGSGATHSGSVFDEFRIPLRRGWTQIGNPYVYEVSWEEILAANPEVEGHVGALRVYNGGNFTDSPTLPQFRGGFVFADDAGFELRIPVRQNVTKSFSLQVEPEEDFSTSWKIGMELSAKYIRNVDLGFGMHANASASKDRFDVMATPRFLSFADATFHHPEYFYPNFATDIVPLSDSHIWDFTAETSFENEIATLEWDNQKAQWLGNSLKLLDVRSLTLVDMKATNHYSFISNGKREFKILYGSQEFINNALVLENTILGDCYPNPMEDKTTIPVYLQGDESGYSQIDVSIYSIDGRKVATIAKGTIRNGYHEFEWNSGNVRGFKTGIYLYTLNNFTDGTTQTKRMVIVK